MTVAGGAAIGGMAAVTFAWALVRFVRWQYVLRRASVRWPARASLQVFLVSLVGAAVPAGEAVRALLARRRFGAPAGRVAAVVAIDLLLDLTALSALALLGALVSTDLHAGGGALDAAGDAGMRVALVGIAAGAGALTLLGVAGPLIGMPVDAVRVLRRPGNVAWSLGASLGAWALVSVNASLAGVVVGAPLGPLASLMTVPAQILTGGWSAFAAWLPADALAVNQWGAYGVSAADAAAMLSLSRTAGAATLLVLVVAGMAAWAAARGASTSGDAAVHFDEIAPEYGNQFSGHIWNHLLERKVGFMAGALPPPERAGIGLDLGCGLGEQCLALGQRGFTVVGMDISRGLATQAGRAGVTAAVGSAMELPFRDQSLDFVYAVGVLHHLPDVASQELAYREVARVLRPGGRLLIHETNPRNPLYRFYMGYVFPVLKSIDEGIEWWISPRRWSSVPGLPLVRIEYFTFMPDFIPAWLLPPFRALDRMLESSPLRPFSVHYFAVMERAPDGRGAR